MLTRSRVIAAAAVLGLFATACGADDEPIAPTTEDTAPDEPADDPATDEPATDEPATDEPATDEPSTDEPAADDAADEDAPADADLTVATTDLGDVLVDGDGMTLYLFTNDSEGESVCEGDCADAWPPLVVDDVPSVGDGLDPDLVGTIERSDGSTQVTYAGSPLYNWASDTEPGDVTGQGVNDVWFVVDPTGEPIRDGG